jgi:hypothetical protein
MLSHTLPRLSLTLRCSASTKTILRDRSYKSMKLEQGPHTGWVTQTALALSILSLYVCSSGFNSERESKDTSEEVPGDTDIIEGRDTSSDSDVLSPKVRDSVATVTSPSDKPYGNIFILSTAERFCAGNFLTVCVGWRIWERTYGEPGRIRKM